MNGEFDLVIRPGHAMQHYWRDIWRYRELLVFLAWRDILVRYKQTVIGVAWSVIRPLVTMVIFTVVFGTLARLPSEGNAPYPILVFSAMLPWQLFATALSSSSGSLLGSAGIISKVYFPRLIVPVSAVIVSLVEFLIAFGLLLLLMLWYGWPPTARLVALPVLLLPGMMAAVGIGLCLAALNVRYRDVGHVVPFMLQLGLYISPVGFSSSLIPPSWRLLFSTNPMVGVIDGFRWAILGEGAAIYWPGLLLSSLTSALFLAAGLMYFRRNERTFADLI